MSLDRCWGDTVISRKGAKGQKGTEPLTESHQHTATGEGTSWLASCTTDIVMERFGSVRFRGYFARTPNQTIGSVQGFSRTPN
jgi:hypothetical protein